MNTGEHIYLDANPTPEQERRFILEIVGPGRYTIVVPKKLRDAILEQHQFKPKDVPGLVEPKAGWNGIAMRPPRQSFTAKPLPYPPHLKGRYAR